MSDYNARPKALILFAGSGGDAEGWAERFDVTCVDNDPARVTENPHRTILGDALEYAAEHGQKFDFIAAGPPCWAYSRGTIAIGDRTTRYPRLIGATRAVLQHVGKPYTIENVEGAKSELESPLTLCWTAFHRPGSVLDEDGTPLWMRRHRLYESPLPIMAPGCFHPRNMQCAGAYGGARRDKDEARNVRHGGYVPTLPVMRALLGTPWMNERGCQLAIPPAYTRYLANQIVEWL